MSQHFKTVDVLRLEVGDETPAPGSLPNLLLNPRGQMLGLSGWSGVNNYPADRYMSLLNPGFRFTVPDGGTIFNVRTAIYFNTVETAGAMQLTGRVTRLGSTLTSIQAPALQLRKIDTTGAVSSMLVDFRIDADGVLTIPVVSLPAGTIGIDVRIRSMGVGDNSGEYLDVDDLFLVVGTPAEIAAWVPAQTEWTDVLGPTHDIKIVREELNTGTLAASVLDSTLDPSQSDLIRPGRLVRLLALDAATDTWTPEFVGEALNASVTYHLKEPGIPESKRARIQINAVDPAAQLASTKRAEGVATISELPYVLAGARVPWNVNGVTVGVDPDTVTPVAYNDNASALDQVAITRDSVLGHAWIDRFGALQAWDSASLPTEPVAELTEATYTDLDLSFNTEDCINEVTLKFLRINPTTGETEEIDYGPYRNEESIRIWGVRSAEFTVQGISEETADLADYATAILDANSTPHIRINSITLPIAQASDLNPALGLLDLYDLVTVSNHTTTDLSHQARITRIEHTITPDKWMMLIGFSAEGTVASPQFTPSPSTGAGGLTIGQLLRPVGEVTMFGGPIPAGWLELNGSTFDPEQYPRLYAYLGNTNVLPDVTDRFPIGAGTKALGSTGGSPTVDVPNHSHGAGSLSTNNYSHNQATDTQNGGSRARLQGPETHSHNVTGTTSQGGAHTIDIMPPWLAIRFAIRAV